MSSINIEKISIVHWYPDLERHLCGYCTKENGAVSYGMWAEQLNVEDYQNLIDRGWRRSGMYCYKPMMDVTCCPQYTIKCSVSEFKLSKSQKKIIKKFNKFIADGTGYKEATTSNAMVDSTPREEIVIKEKPSISLDYSRLNSIDTNQLITETNSDYASASCSSAVTTENTHDKRATVEKHLVGADPNKPPCKKAKFLRLQRKQQKLLEKGIVFEKRTPPTETKTLEHFLKEIPPNSKHKFKIKLIPNTEIDSDFQNIKILEFQLYRKYQMAVHNDTPEQCSLMGFTRFLISSPLKIQQERMNKNHPTFKICSELFKKYQMAIHNEPVSQCGEKQFCEFLIDTPLKSVRVRGASSPVTYGTFHQQYWLDDKLIAVAVLDILPRCVSSVYFFYDPDYRFLTLGTYGSLREVNFVQSLSKSVPAIKLYYMGFYIHSCQKMRYKGKLSNSFLLCPETYNWLPIEKCLSKLDKNKYSRLNDDLDAVDENLCTDADINCIKVCVSYSFTLFGNYKQKYGEQEVFNNIGRLIGKKNASSLLFVSSKG